MEDKSHLFEILDSIGDGIYILDAEANILHCNKAMSGYIDGWSGEIIGHKCWEVIHGTDYPVDGCPFLSARETHQKASMRFQKNGRWLNLTSHPILTDKGVFEGAVNLLLDVTEGKLLSEDDEKYRQLFELESDALFLIDNKTGNILEVNEAAANLYGFMRNKLMMMKHTDLSAEPEETRKTTLTGQIYVPVRWHRKSDGTVFPVEITAKHFVWQGGPVHIAAIRDITERMLANDALRASEERCRSLIDYNPDGVYSLDLKGVFLDANEACCRATGYSREEFMQMNFTPLLVPENVESVWRHFEKVSNGKPQNYETTIVHKDGHRMEFNITNSPIIVNDEIVGVYGIAKDITEHKRVEEALRESEERFRALFDRSLDYVYVVDLKGKLIDANLAVLNLLGYDRSDIPSLNTTSFVDNDQLVKILYNTEELMKAGIQKNIHEYKLRHKDGGYVDVESKTSIILRDGRPHAILGIARDITERKRMEAEQQQSFERIRKALGATVQAIAVMVETRDPYTAGHQRKVADLARAIATEMNLPNEQIDGIRTAGVIHDIGKIAVPAEILSKPKKLTDAEFSLIKNHPQSGYDILKDIEFPWPIARIVLEHHERMNGSGYPNGVTGDNLLIESKILAVADVVEAIASHRPYRAGLGIGTALDEITKNKGVLFDPQAVNACLRLFREKKYTIAI